MTDQEQPFSLLPEALVEELLDKSESVGKTLLRNLKEINSKKQSLRKQLLEANLLKREADLVYSPIPTTCAVDGSFAVEKLMGTDLVACAAVAIEGLVPPSETRHWERPHHKVFIHPEKHNPDTSMIIRGIMWEMEIELASKAPHDIVFIDGSLTNPIVNLNPAVNQLYGFKDSILGKTLIEQFKNFINSYKTILDSNRTDKLWVGLPKYTSKREIGNQFDWLQNYDDRAILTSILNSGEYTAPVPYEQPEEPWHLRLPYQDSELKTLLGNIFSALDRLHIIYYKPHSYTPVLRIEVPQSIISNQHQLSLLLKAINFQCGSASIIEPYPLYMADRMVKSLSRAIPAFRQTATKKMAESFEVDLSQVVFSMHSYRTEDGR